MEIELEFFEYPKHKPELPEYYSGIIVLAFTKVSDALVPLLYSPNGRYIFDDLFAGSFNYEPHVTHWAYLPKKL